MRVLPMFLLAGFLSACSTGSDPVLSPGGFFVTGVVTDQASIPVENTRIDVAVHVGKDSCDSLPGEPVATKDWSDSQGRFSFQVNYIHVDEFPACAVITAIPPAGLSLVSETKGGFRVILRQPENARGMDTLQVSFELDAAL